jgi:hypothetical protein
MNLSITRPIHVAVIIAASLFWAAAAQSQNLVSLMNLRGTWKFEIGDNMLRAKVNFDDSRWTEIRVPGAWEDQGFQGYDGYAWYRKHFVSPAAWKGKYLYLQLGTIDDADEVYLNGHMIGFWGSFPPDYITAYSVSRKYYLPVELLNPDGDNVLAVRVYDAEFAGGITGGDIGIYERQDQLWPDQKLETGWVFRTGDDPSWKDVVVDTRDWRAVSVPAYWETQGFPGYDGFGWYRLKFKVTSGLASERLMLELGRIDDLDEVYLNGQRIGSTGKMPTTSRPPIASSEYLQFRVYTVPPELLNPGGENVLAVRVYDNFMQGGIYDGPIGLVKQETYRRWKDHQPAEHRGWFWDLLDRIFR